MDCRYYTILVNVILLNAVLFSVIILTVSERLFEIKI